MSPSKRYPPARSFNLREAFLLPILWRLLVRLNLIFPVAVKEKRFAAAFFDFIFILIFTFKCRSLNLQRLDCHRQL